MRSHFVISDTIYSGCILRHNTKIPFTAESVRLIPNRMLERTGRDCPWTAACASLSCTPHHSIAYCTSLEPKPDRDGNVFGTVVGGRIACACSIGGARLVVDPHVPALYKQLCPTRIRKLVSESRSEVHSLYADELNNKMVNLRKPHTHALLNLHCLSQPVLLTPYTSEV